MRQARTPARLKNGDRQSRQAHYSDGIAPVKRNFVSEVKGVDEEDRQRYENELHPANCADEQHRRVARSHGDVGHALRCRHRAATGRRCGRSLGEAGGCRLNEFACVERVPDGNPAPSRPGRRLPHPGLGLRAAAPALAQERRLADKFHGTFNARDLSVFTPWATLDVA